MAAARILAVDDEKDMTRLLQRTLESEIDCSVHPAFSGNMALAALEQDAFDLVICDIKMPGMDGFELLEQIRLNYPELTVVMLTAFGNIDSAVKAIKTGAYDFIAKPFENSEIIFKISKALERSRLIKENKRLMQQNQPGMSGLIGKSDSMKKVFEKINMIAPTDSTVLITGESGTGKDITARSIHALSLRKNKPFIPVNCPAIPEHILESELFGYKKGAFTNASVDKLGLFQEADGGTIFLDEIGDIGISVQTKLLRVLQEKEIKPLGDTKVKKVDVRIIASTNSNLEQKIADNQFRQDVFYRLNVLPIELPPLRERITDIPILCRHLVKKHCEELKKEPKIVSEPVMDMFMRYSWPGNIRELENIILQGILYAQSDIIESQNIPSKIFKGDNSLLENLYQRIDTLPYKDAKEQILRDFNHDYIGAKLSMTSGNVAQAARLCSIDRQALQQVMKRYDINPEPFRKPDEK